VVSSVLQGEGGISSHPQGYFRDSGEARQNVLRLMLLLVKVRRQNPFQVRIRIDSFDVAGGVSQRTICLRTVHRAGSLDHRHDIVIVFRLQLLKVKLKVSRKLAVCVIVSCVINECRDCKIV